MSGSVLPSSFRLRSFFGRTALLGVSSKIGANNFVSPFSQPNILWIVRLSMAKCLLNDKSNSEYSPRSLQKVPRVHGSGPYMIRIRTPKIMLKESHPPVSKPLQTSSSFFKPLTVPSAKSLAPPAGLFSFP